MMLRLWLLIWATAAGPGRDAAVPVTPTAPAPWVVDPPDGVAVRAEPRPSAGLRALGRTLYQARCAGCHGTQGDGRSPVSAQLHPRPTDFTRGVYKVRSTPSGTLPVDADLFRTLTRGLHGTAMQPWRKLSERERWALVSVLKSFSPRFAHEAPGDVVEVPITPRELDDMRDYGEELYVKFGCGGCHGETGAGDGAARELARKQGRRELRARDFTRGRFLRGSEMEDIYLTLRTGLDGTPMTAYDSLSDDGLWSLAAYVRLLIRERPLEGLPPARQVASPGWASTVETHGDR